MTITVNTRAYALDNASGNAAVYTGPASTFSARDLLTLKRTAPKPSGDFAGVARAEAKMTKTVTLTGVTQTKGDAIVSISLALPVGMSEADVDTLKADIVSLAGTTNFKDLIWKHDINQ